MDKVDSLPRNPVAIAGGGLAGLTALACLARANVPSVLLEKSDSVGGRAKTDSIEGFAFNLGAHALYRSGAAHGILRELGVEIHGHRPPVRGGFAILGGRKRTMPAGLLSLLVTDLLPLSAKLEMSRLMRLLMKRSSADESPRSDGSFAEWLDENVESDPLRMFVLALLRVSTYSTRPDAIAAKAALTQIRMGIFEGVEYLDHGWGSIVEGLARCAIAAGGTIVRGVRVERIEHDDRARAIRLAGGETIPISAAILAMPPRAAASLLEGAPKSWCEAEALRAIPATVACLDVALRQLPDPRARFALGIDRPLYFSVHSASAKLAPAGGALVHLMKYGGDEGSAPDRERVELEALLDLMQPGWHEEVVHARFLPEMVASHAVARPSGVPPRPDGPVPGVEGLYVAGDWVGADHHLADAACASGRAQAESAIARAIRSPQRAA
jgi:phytoene dehydrogenase-like protein